MFSGGVVGNEGIIRELMELDKVLGPTAFPRKRELVKQEGDSTIALAAEPAGGEGGGAGG